MSIALIFSSFLAGMLTIFSPCVLPMVPFVVRSSLQKSKFGPIYLGAGLSFSFSLTTYFIASTGQLFGLTPDRLKLLSGIFLLLASLLFVFPNLTDKLSMIFSPLNNKLARIGESKKVFNSNLMEFFNGVLLGPVWAPCSGPTLAIIIGIIINTPETKSAIILLAIFSFGSILPILFFSYGATKLIVRVKAKSLESSHNGKLVLGIICGIMSLLILTGLDKNLETILLNILPEFITNLSLSI